MSNYRKERNNIIISLDGMSGDYRLDINTGVLYGIKGTPIKICPRKSEVINLFPYIGLLWFYGVFLLFFLSSSFLFFSVF